MRLAIPSSHRNLNESIDAHILVGPVLGHLRLCIVGKEADKEKLANSFAHASGRRCCRCSHLAYFVARVRSKLLPHDSSAGHCRCLGRMDSPHADQWETNHRRFNCSPESPSDMAHHPVTMASSPHDIRCLTARPKDHDTSRRGQLFITRLLGMA